MCLSSSLLFSLGEFVLCGDWSKIMVEHNLDPTGNAGVLRRPTESIAAPIGLMCHDILRQHVAAQRGNRGDDDAGSHRHPAAPPAAARAIGSRQQVLKSGSSYSGLRHADRRLEHVDRYRSELDTDRNVEEPGSRSKAYQLQHLVLLRIPFCCFDVNLVLVHHMFDVCEKGFGSGFGSLFG